MPNFIIALIIIFGGLWLIRKFARVQPAQIPGLMKKLTGGLTSGVLGKRLGKMKMPFGGGFPGFGR